MIQRYRFTDFCVMVDNEAEWIEYADHLDALAERDKLIEEMARCFKKHLLEDGRYCEAAGGIIGLKHCEGCDDLECDRAFVYTDKEATDIIARAEAMKGGK